MPDTVVTVTDLVNEVTVVETDAIDVVVVDNVKNVTVADQVITTIDAPAGQGPQGIAGVDATISANTKGFVNHGSTASTARPATYGSVEWYGSVQPTNATSTDTWFDTS